MLSFINALPSRRSRTPETRVGPSSPFDKLSKLSHPSPLSPGLSARSARSPERTIVALQLAEADAPMSDAPMSDAPMSDAPVAAPVVDATAASAQVPEVRAVDAPVQDTTVPDVTVPDVLVPDATRQAEDEDGSNSTPRDDPPEDEIQIHIASSASPPKKDASDSKRYPVHKILDFRRAEDGVDLLVKWGGNWLRDEPTWEPEEVLWNSCRQKVVKFWSPNGWNRRNRLLKLDPVAGPFTVNRILGERKIRKTKGRENGGMAYLVEFLGYERPEWTAEDCLPESVVEEWKAERETYGEAKPKRGRKPKP